MVRSIDDQHREWKRHRWQKMNTTFLKEECSKQLESIKELPDDAFMWDVYMGLTKSITLIQVSLKFIAHNLISTYSVILNIFQMKK